MGSWQRIFHHRQMKMALFRMTNHLGSTAFGVEGSNGHFSIFEENCWNKFFTLLIRLLSLQLCSMVHLDTPNVDVVQVWPSHWQDICDGLDGLHWQGRYIMY